jgi:hypothetical protein
MSFARCFAQPKPTRATFFFLIAITLIIVQGLGINPRAYNYLPSLPAVIAPATSSSEPDLRYSQQCSAWSRCLPHRYQIFLYPVGTNSCVCLIWDNWGHDRWMLVSFITVLKPRRAPYFLRDSLRDVAAESRDDQKVSTALGEANRYWRTRTIETLRSPPRVPCSTTASYVLPQACRTRARHAVATTVSRSESCGLNPMMSCARQASATRTGGSPGRCAA